MLINVYPIKNQPHRSLHYDGKTIPFEPWPLMEESILIRIVRDSLTIDVNECEAATTRQLTGAAIAGLGLKHCIMPGFQYATVQWLSEWRGYPTAALNDAVRDSRSTQQWLARAVGFAFHEEAFMANPSGEFKRNEVLAPLAGDPYNPTAERFAELAPLLAHGLSDEAIGDLPGQSILQVKSDLREMQILLAADRAGLVMIAGGLNMLPAHPAQ